ncbi:MAG: alpha/beta hydrolase [Rhizobiaceae bacterium]
MKQLSAALLVFFVSLQLASADNYQLAPYKDKLFAYPATLEQSGSYRLLDYNKQRDIIARDKIPLRKTHQQFVDEGVRWSRRVRSYKSPNGKFKYFSTGKKKGARVTVIWIHGLGGNRRQGVSDWTFGGNFNRLQNLMTKNKGILVSPDFTDFKDKGATDIKTLMTEYKRRSPEGSLILACGSMGGGICWRLAEDPTTAAMMNGMFILGSHWHDDFLKSSTIKKSGRTLPIYFGHGTKDVTFKAKVQRNFFNKIRKINPAYPARFIMFNKGVHGTPMRMVDWRTEINWMLSLK